MTTETQTPLVSTLPFGFARRCGVLVDSIEGGVARVLVRPDSSEASWREVRRRLAMPLNIVRCPDDQFRHALEQLYGDGESNQAAASIDFDDDFDLEQGKLPGPQDLLEENNDAPVIRLINAVLRRAVHLGASDVHIEPFEEELRARVRIDGRLQTIYTTRRSLAGMVVSRIKVMANLDIAEKRLPQDGRIALRIASRIIDVRVSTLPGPHGERVVMRILDKRSGRYALDQIGLRPEQYAGIKKMLTRPTGIVLVTGPTGSGKTTSLYAMMAEIDGQYRNILTVEDPIEYELPGVGQTQVNAQIGMTFARSLRAILRQDPDVILVGEIRDSETAQIAVQASLTGHLVFSTLHTNSAIGAVTRLRDMGIESFLLSSTISGLIAQRLVRLACPQCKTAHPIPAGGEELFAEAGLDVPAEVWSGKGCSHCTGTGYRGRMGIYEVFAVDDEMREMIYQDRSEREIELTALKSGDSLRASALRLVAEGATSLEEAVRVSRGDQ